MTSSTVLLEERGRTDLTPTVWTTLSDNLAFRRLLETGILSASLLGNGLARLHASCYVGRAQFGDVTIEIREKVAGVLGALLSYATGAAFRIEHTKSPSSDIGQLTLLLIREFLTAVRRYVSRSREFVYEQERKVGCLVGGQIDVGTSIRLRARGLGHLLAFNKNVITFNTLLNRVVLATLIEIERIAQLIDVDPMVMERARGLSLLFSDCRESRLLTGNRSAFARDAQSLAETPLTPAQRDVAALASVILAHEGFEWDVRTGSQVPRSWFLNLERLFERAVIVELQEVVETGTSVYGGIDQPRPVFEQRTNIYKAHPDVVVTKDDGRIIVGDAKYKDWSGKAVASDLYQLLIHTAAFSGTQSFLVFPNEEYQAIRLGKAVTGADTWLFALDVTNLKQGVAQMAGDLGIETGNIEREASLRGGDVGNHIE